MILSNTRPVILNAEPTDRFLGACQPCLRPVRATVENTTGGFAWVACPRCGQPVRGERLYATVTGEPCHSRCMGATGPSCSCACGGINHGGLFEQEGEATEAAVNAYRAVLARQAAQKQARRRVAQDDYQQWADDHEDVVAYLHDPARFDHGGQEPSTFLYEMAYRLRRQEPLTHGQTRGVRRWAEARRTFETRKAAEAAAARPVPTGDRVEIAGVVATTWTDDNPFGPETVARMLVKGDGWRVWSTIPKALVTIAHGMNGRRGTVEDLRGRTVSFTATVTAKPGDPSTGNAKRPRNAALLDATHPQPA